MVTPARYPVLASSFALVLGAGCAEDDSGKREGGAAAADVTSTAPPDAVAPAPSDPSGAAAIPQPSASSGSHDEPAGTGAGPGDDEGRGAGGTTSGTEVMPVAGGPADSASEGTPATAGDAGSQSREADAGTASALDGGDASVRRTITPLKVMTFNIRYDDGQSTTGQHAWNAQTNPRRQRVVNTIQDVAPDLLGVQEALSNQVSDLTQALADFAFVGVGRDDGATRGEYAGVFYRQTRFMLTDSGHFWLSETPEVPGTVFSGSGSTRMATWVVVRDLANDREMFFLNTHWDNVSQASRERSAELVRERLGSLGLGRPLVLTGDLNQSESNVAVQTLLSTEPSPETALVDAYREAFPLPSRDEATYHDFTGTTQGSRIDFVLHDANFATTSAMIVRDEVGGLLPSDHFAVWAVLEWRE